MKELNAEVSIISRVVVHPKYRTIGLGEKMIRETLALAGTPCVEMVAIMAKYNPFAEKAGMQKIAVKHPDQKVLNVAKTLDEFGFDLQLLNSEKYIQQKIEALSLWCLEETKKAFIKNKHPRFKKTVAAARHLPFGNTDSYITNVKQANSEKIRQLIKLFGMLLQSKIYLFWKHHELKERA
jgi:hypothetical protein